MADPRTAGLPMSSFLLRPMQRVTKYPLLIERVRFEKYKEGDAKNRKKRTIEFFYH